MAKKLHLVCNAHLDPVWQWEWEEGAAEALSTFRIAADFCEEYDRFVFCHNEALLYKWIEEYDLPLFERIRDLVKRGKWHIMGGWFLQPDCNMPSGEAMVRQIQEGRKYFLEKFGVVPEVAINVDPFGHSRGLVQILKKTGYEGYLFMRPNSGRGLLELPAPEIKWVGYDGSEVTGIHIHSNYNSMKGKAIYKVQEYIDLCAEDDFFLCLWGIGNHGGGPSKKDLDDIENLQAELNDVELIHSTPEAYLAEVKDKRTLPEWKESINPVMVGCYTSQVRVKQKYRLAENTYFLTESMASHAASAGLMDYPEKELAEAMYDIMLIQFHDILPGSSIQPAEEMGIRLADHALEILSRIKAKAFFALARGQKKADPDKIPVFVYNPYPYEIAGDFVCEFMLWDQYLDPGFMEPHLYDEKGNVVPVQCEKEDSNIPMEWRKRIVFHTTLKPMCINRFDCAFEIIPEKPKKVCDTEGDCFVFKKGDAEIHINRKTGLLDHYIKDGVSYLEKDAMSLLVFEDNFDPWGMRVKSFPNQIGAFSLLTPDETQAFCCLDEEIEPVHVIESGDVRTVIEAVFGYNSSRAVIKYILSETDGLKTDIRIVWDEKQKMVKLKVPTDFAKECIGEHMYGRETLKDGLLENVSQKYIALCDEQKALITSNNGTYGSSYDKGVLYYTLLRSPGYTAHPVEQRPVMPTNRYMPYIEQGERDFSFRFDGGEKQEMLNKAARIAQQFNVKPMSLSFYPSGLDTKPEVTLSLSDDCVCITAFKQSDDKKGYIVRLFNPTEQNRTTVLSYKEQKTEISFSAFEIKTIYCASDKMEETDILEGLLN